LSPIISLLPNVAGGRWEPARYSWVMVQRWLLTCVLIACTSCARGSDSYFAGSRSRVSGLQTAARSNGAVEATEAGLVDIPFTDLARGVTSGARERRTVVVRDQQALNALFAEMYGSGAPERSAPPVDFASRMAIGVYLGTRRSGGFSVAIERVAAEPGGKNIVVFAFETEPPRGAMVTQALTYPFHLVTIPASTGEVKFVLSVRPR